MIQALSLEQIEANLDSDCLKAIMRTSANGYSLYSVRRNGRTRLWKRNPLRYEIPVKVGFREYRTITPTTVFGVGDISHSIWPEYKVMPQNLAFDPRAQL